MIEMDILDSATEGGVEVAKNVLIQLVDNSKAGRDRIVRKAGRENLAKAMDLSKQLWDIKQKLLDEYSN